MGWYLLAGAGGAVLTLLLHELSHAVVVKAYGGEIVSFRPYPHKDEGRWWFGYVSYLLTPPHPALIHVAPLLVSFPLSGLWIYLALAKTPYLAALAFWEVANIVWWFIGYFSSDGDTDGYKWRATRAASRLLPKARVVK